MVVLGICGSPRRGGNTEVLLTEALKGAREAGAEVEEIQAACELGRRLAANPD